MFSDFQLTDYSWFQVDKDSPGDVFPGPGLTEEGVEGIVPTPNSLVAGHLTIRLDPVFQTIQFPAGIADLDSGLTNMDRDTFTLWKYYDNSFSVNTA